MKKPVPSLPREALVEFITKPGPEMLDLNEAVGLLQSHRQSPEFSMLLDGIVIQRLRQYYGGLMDAKENMTKLQGVLEKLSGPPWFPGIFIKRVESPRGPKALVRQGSTSRVVGFCEVEPPSLQTGDEVYLSPQENAIVARSSQGPQDGETCQFERKLSGDRIMVRSRDEDLVVSAVPTLLAANLKAGDPLLFQRESRIALERIERKADGHLFLEQTPQETFCDVGGLDRQVRELQNTLALHWKHAAMVQRYGLKRKGSILLCGPPGTGKTLLARAFANFLATVSPSGQSRFINVKPGGMNSMWFGESEKNIRELFRLAREAATPECPAVIFFDEVDAIGAARGQTHMRVHDNTLTALIAELDGMADRGNVLVIAATNRLEALDPALLRAGRLGDLILHVPRPGRKAALDIFCKHLASDVPFARNGHGEDWSATRLEIIEAALSSIYAPNADSELATIQFRDGRKRVLRSPDLISGALIANIVRAAKETACLRELADGTAGLQAKDMLAAVAREFASAAQSITPGNCRQHIADLPQDLDVVKVEMTSHKLGNPTRFLNTV